MTIQEALKYLRNGILRFISWIYGTCVWIRNKAYDMGILKSRSFDVPVIVIGNLAVGGTGKTPHTEYVISQLCKRFNVGVLSRGYMRATKGFVLANSKSTPSDIGDEPYQIYKKFFGGIKLAVCEDRCSGIDQLLDAYPDINLLVLDDAFQHRAVNPDIAIVLMEFDRMPYNDQLLPYGRLREHISGLTRASMVVVTKCPDAAPLEYRLRKNDLALNASQSLHFSRYEYMPPQSVFPEEVTYVPDLSTFTADDLILVVTGIANPRPFTKHLRTYGCKVKSIRFPDHHNFGREDLVFIRKRIKELPGRKKVILTTEKDAVRMSNNPYFPQDLKKYVFYIPIRVEFNSFLNSNFNDSLDALLRQVAANKSISSNTRR